MANEKKLTKCTVLLTLGAVLILVYTSNFSENLPAKPTVRTTTEMTVTSYENLTQSFGINNKTIQNNVYGLNIATENSTTALIFHTNSPSRNLSDLRFHLAGIRQIMKPFIRELRRVRVELKSNDIQWVNTRQFPTVVNGYTEGYFQNVSHPQIKTLIVNVKKDEISKHLYSHVYDYSGSNCKQLETGSPHRKSGGILYGAKCVSKEELINAVPFHDRSFKLGMPGNLTVQRHGHVALTYIHVIHKAIVNRQGDVYVGNLKIVPQRCRQTLVPTKPGKITKAVDKEVFTIAQLWGNGFFHAMAEDLPRLSPWLDFLTENKNIKIHVHTNTGFLRTMMRILGIDPSRMVTGSRRVKVLYMPAGTACGRTAVFNAQLLSMQFRNAVKSPVEPRKSIIVIKRSAKRYFKHHSAIFKMIQDAVKGTDIEVELFTDTKLPTVEETMAMFSRAFMVVGPHGAGETNLLFSEKGTVVIEGMSVMRGRVNLCYRNLMRVLAHRFYGVYPNQTCNDIKPNELEDPLKFYINTLYLNNSKSVIPAS